MPEDIDIRWVDIPLPRQRRPPLLHITHGIRHTLLRPAFWLGLTLSFPIEHLLWEKVPIFSAITHWMGL